MIQSVTTSARSLISLPESDFFLENIVDGLFKPMAIGLIRAFKPFTAACSTVGGWFKKPVA